MSGLRIAEVSIRNFRVLQDVWMPLGETTVLIGANNSGKTAFLDALDVAIGDRTRASEDDLFVDKDGKVALGLGTSAHESTSALSWPSWPPRRCWLDVSAGRSCRGRCARAIDVEETECGTARSSAVHGSADLILETHDGFVLVDHKSFPGKADEAVRRAGGHAGQLAAYARALGAATGRKVKACYVHLPLSGLVVPVSGP